MTASPQSRRPRSSLPRLGALAGALALLVAVLPVAPAHGATPLVGTFQLKSGSCSGGRITGTYFRMILPSGNNNGPFMANSDSTCSDQTFTPLRPGSDGGLITGGYQPTPSPAFDGKGNARAGRVTSPARYYGTGFATATNSTDPQTKTRVSAPRIFVDGSRLSGDLRAFSVTWNNQYFNQGAPKPNGSLPGSSRAPSGTYNAATRAFTLTWSSTIVGGPFDKFTGQWHLEGTFVPAKGTSAPPAGSGAGSGAPAAGSAGQGGGGAVGGASVPPGEAVVDPETGELLSTSGTAGVPTRSVVTEKGLTVEPWLLALTLGIAVLGFGGLGALTWATRRQAGDVA